MDEGKDLSLLFLMIHVQTGHESEDHKGHHHERNLAMDPCHEDPAPVNVHHGHASQHASQQYAEGNLPQNCVPLPPKNHLVVKMKKPKALQPEEEYIQGQQYGQELNDRMNNKHVMYPFTGSTS